MKNLAENPTPEKPKNKTENLAENNFGSQTTSKLNECITEHDAFVQLESILNNSQSEKAMASNQKTVKIELTENQVYNLSLLDKARDAGFLNVSKTLQTLFFSYLIYSQEKGDGLNLLVDEIHDVKTAIEFFSELKE